MKKIFFYILMIFLLAGCKDEEPVSFVSDSLEFSLRLEKDPVDAGKIWVRDFSYQTDEALSGDARLFIQSSGTYITEFDLASLSTDQYFYVNKDGTYELNVGVSGHRYQYDTAINVSEFPDFIKITRMKTTKSNFVNDDRVRIEFFDAREYSYYEKYAPVNAVENYPFIQPLYLEIDAAYSGTFLYNNNDYRVKLTGQQDLGSVYYDHSLVDGYFNILELIYGKGNNGYKPPGEWPTEVVIAASYNSTITFTVEWINNQ